jgi:hypothetical protein
MMIKIQGDTMKLKYKKIILLTTMSTMGIGLLTISVSQDNPKAEESFKTNTAIEASMLADTTQADSSERSMSTLAYDTNEVTEDTSTTVTLSPTPIPTPTPWPVNPLEKDKYPEIEQLFVDYYTAKNSSDVDKLKSLLSDPSKVETKEQLQSKTEYIEDYNKIKTYTKKSVEEGTYIVYVYSEIKFNSVNTAAPGLAKFYVTTGEDNKLKIYSGEMDAELKAYFDERNQDPDVQKIIEMTNDKSDKAKEKDEDLLNFWENIDEMASKNKKTAEGDSAE